MSLNTLIVFSRLEEAFLSFELGLLLASSSTILWLFYNTFWETYEKHQKKLDK